MEQALAAYRTYIEDAEASSKTPGSFDFTKARVALTLVQMGREKQASFFHEKTENSWGPVYVAYYALTGQAELAEEQLERQRKWGGGPGHSLATGHQSDADYYAYRNQIKKSVASQDKARQLFAQEASVRLPKLTETQRIQFIEREYLPSLHKALSLGLDQRENPRAAALSAGWLINGKAVTEEALAEASLLSSEEAYPIVQQLGEVRRQLASVNVNADIVSPSTKKQLAKLESEQTRLQSELAKFNLGDAVAQNWVPVGNIINSLTDDSCFVTVAKIRPFDISKTYTHHKLGWRPEYFKEAWLPERYVAWVVPPLGLGNVQCIDLGDASKIDEAITRVRKQLTSAAAKIGNASEAALESELKSGLATLSMLVFCLLYTSPSPRD